MIRCKECGSAEVQSVAWIDPNKQEILDDFGSWGEIDTKFCSRCDDHVKLEDDGVMNKKTKTQRAVRIETGNGSVIVDDGGIILTWQPDGRQRALNWEMLMNLAQHNGEQTT